MFQPWRVHLCNLVDAAMIQSLVTVLLCGALFIPETPQKEVLVVLTVGVIGWVVFGTAIAIAYALPSPQCQQLPDRIAGRKNPKRVCHLRSMMG